MAPGRHWWAFTDRQMTRLPEMKEAAKFGGLRLCTKRSGI